MHKLKLESLQVESFETTRMGHRGQGTVHGNAAAAPVTTQPNTAVAACSPSVVAVCSPSYAIACGPSVMICPATQYVDCTYGCSLNTGCAASCYADGNTLDCPVG